MKSTIKNKLSEILEDRAPVCFEENILDLLFDNVIEKDPPEYDPEIDAEFLRILDQAETDGSVSLETFRRFHDLTIDRSRSESKYYIGVGIRIALEIDKLIHE